MPFASVPLKIPDVSIPPAVLLPPAPPAPKWFLYLLQSDEIFLLQFQNYIYVLEIFP